jgi:hypothetical protein
MVDEPDYVSLKDVLKRVQTQRSVAVEAAQDIIRRAHQIGDLELRIRHPGGSFGYLRDDVWGVDPYHGETWRMLFDEGVIEVEIPQGRRRAGPFETCRIYGIRKNLESFLGIPESTSPGPIAGTLRRFDAADRALFDNVGRLMGEGLSLTAATRKGPPRAARVVWPSCTERSVSSRALAPTKSI